MKLGFTFIKNLIQLMLSPVKGWEDVSASNAETKLLAKECMFPLFALSALSVFVQAIFHPSVSAFVWIIKAAVIFVSFFITYVVDLFVFDVNLHKYVDGAPNSHKYTTVLIYALSLLSISTLVCNFVPVSFGLNVLLPLAITLIVWKSDRYLFVKESKNANFLFFVLITVSMPPVAIQFLFDWILNG